ncbi:hypothetical protein ACFYRC_12975 [Streptomyces sp. NPDC005279]|uniref:hypothetical protein n=1 Tax=Streptomyces sp. NPDC005279 TaxID=3364712 RepID=UPI0036B79DCC
MTTNNRVGGHPRARRGLVRPAGIRAVAAGASPAGVQPQDAARVLLGPACSFRLFVEG